MSEKSKNLKKELTGSKTAKNGFNNEIRVTRLLNINGNPLREWIMKKDEDFKNKLTASKNKGTTKKDVLLSNDLLEKGIQAKLVSNNKSGFNQVDRGWVDRFINGLQKMGVETPSKIIHLLKLFDGEEKNALGVKSMKINKMSELDQKYLLSWFTEHKQTIVDFVLTGNDKQLTYVIISVKDGANIKDYPFTIKEYVKFYGNGDVEITKRGCLQIGKIKLQRKGGDGGRETANQLQFKINPLSIIKDGDKQIVL